jgi:hypothetical protein
MDENIENGKKEEQPSPGFDEEVPANLRKGKLIGRIGRALFRTLIYSVFFIFLLIASAGLLLEYYFPAEKARVIAEGQLTQILKLPLRIQKLGFSLFSGLQLEGVTLGPAKRPVARVNKVVLDYDLTQLLLGKLVINQALVDRPQLTAISKNGVWNFQPLLEITKPKRAQVEDDKSKLLFPKIDIKELAFRNASALLDQDGKLSAHIDGLSLQAQGKASHDAIDLKLKVLLDPGKSEKPNISFKSSGGLNFQSSVFSNLDFSASDLNRLLISGVFGMQKNQLSMEALSLPSPNVTLEVNASVQRELLTLNHLQMSLGKNNLIQVSGSATNYAKDPSFKLMVNKASFRLKDLLDWGKQWAPPFSGKGLLKAESVKVSGHLPGFVLKNLNLNGGTLSTKNLWINYPDLNARFEGMDADLELKEIALQNTQLKKASIDIKMQLKKGVLQNGEIKKWEQSLNLTAKGKNDVLFKFNTDMKSAHYNHPETKNIFLPVHAEGSGHLKKNNLNNLNLSYRLGTLANGKVTGIVKNFGKKSIKLDQNISLNLAEIASLLPKKLTKDLAENIEGTAKAQTSISGRLSEGYSPEQLKGLANIQLERLTAQLKQPTLGINNLSTQVSFPFEFNSEKGVLIPHLAIQTEVQSAKALNTLQVNALKLDTKIEMKKFHNLKPAFGTLPVQIDTRIALGNLKNLQTTFSLADLKSNFTLKADLQADDVRNTHAEGNLSFKNLSAMKMLKTAKWDSLFNLDVHDKSLTRVRISQKTQIHKPSFQQGDLLFDLESVKLETVSRQNLKEGKVDIDTLLVQSPNLINTRFKAALKEWGKVFEINGKIESLQLGPLWDRLPASLKSDLETLKTGGTLGITLQAKGNLPDNTQNDDESITPPLWRQLLVPANSGGKSPIEVETEIQLNNGFFNDPRIKIHAESLNAKTKLIFKKGQGELKGNITGKLEGLAENPLNPKFEFHYILDNLNTLRINQHHLKLLDGKILHSLSGQSKGLKPFITGQRPIHIKDLLSRLDTELTNTNIVDISQEGSVNTEESFGGIKVQGIIESKIKFHQSAGKTLSLGGKLGFDRFSLHLPSGLALQNLTGTLPFSKSIQLDPGQAMEKSVDFFPAQKKFFTSLRDFSRYKNIIRADALEVEGQTLKDIGLDVVFKDNRLMAEKFIFDVLGGSVGGNLFLIQGHQGPVIKFSTEFAGIDSSKLLTIPIAKKIDSQVDGNLQVELSINTGSKNQPVSLDQLRVKIAITRIGAQTLDRLLLFIDPEESKPAIMDTRAKLKFATPHQVMISLENGNLNVEAWLKSDLLGIIKAPELKRIPIAALKRFNAIHEQLQALKDLQQISNYLSAQKLQFEGEKMTLGY